MVEVPEIVITTKRALVISEAKVKILQMVANDIPRADIAKKMKLSVRTVEGHIDSVKAAFGFKSSIALVAELMRRKIIK